MDHNSRDGAPKKTAVLLAWIRLQRFLPGRNNRLFQLTRAWGILAAFTPSMSLQKLLDNQARHRTQKKLGEGETSELAECSVDRPYEATRGKIKNLRVMSIKKL